jgi:uncharacterized protein YjiS (DUF1127 family)
MTTPTTRRLPHPISGGAAGGGLWAQARSVAGDLVRALLRERELRRAMVLLASFDDRVLHDLGITRGDIEHAVRFGRG